MGPPSSLRITVLYNNDFLSCDPDAHDQAARADVANAAAGVAHALAARGHLANVRAVDAHDLYAALAEIAADPPDLVFNLCESLGGEARHEPVVPALLELAGIAHTGSSPLALGLALRKDRAKELLRSRRVPTPAAATITTLDDLASVEMGFPLIVKPTREDASVGIHSSSVVRDRAALRAAVARVLDELQQPALVEQFIDGREIYVSLLGNDPPVALPFHEIDFTDMPQALPRIVSYRAKWDPASEESIGTRPVRCILDEPTRLRVERAARAAFAALELSDYARVDVRLDGRGTPYVIDVNPNCDLSDGAGFSRAAGFGGLDYPSLIERVCVAAWERTRHVAEQQARRRASLQQSRDAGPAATPTARPPAPAGAPVAGRPVHLRRGERRTRADRRGAR